MFWLMVRVMAEAEQRRLGSGRTEGRDVGGDVSGNVNLHHGEILANDDAVILELKMMSAEWVIIACLGARLKLCSLDP